VTVGSAVSVGGLAPAQNLVGLAPAQNLVGLSALNVPLGSYGLNTQALGSLNLVGTPMSGLSSGGCNGSSAGGLSSSGELQQLHQKIDQVAQMIRNERLSQIDQRLSGIEQAIKPPASPGGTLPEAETLPRPGSGLKKRSQAPAQLDPATEELAARLRRWEERSQERTASSRPAEHSQSRSRVSAEADPALARLEARLRRWQEPPAQQPSDSRVRTGVPRNSTQRLPQERAEE